MERNQVTNRLDHTATQPHPKSLARDYAVQFLFQCECEHIFYFTEAHFSGFSEHFKINEKTVGYTAALVKGCFEHLSEIDEKIQLCSTNWRIDRMPMTDRCVLRMASFELMQRNTPPKVIMNEAIELAKKYGTKDSASFVNGILDKMATLLAQPAEKPENSPGQ
jgi:N utilization substance protein B